MKINIKKMLVTFLCAELLLFYIGLIQPQSVQESSFHEMNAQKIKPALQP
ncbi:MULTISPECIES: hypothetical protein [Paenibacillus]|uniref:Uncharacterized protein n=2 Tax=Paenibacillus TaxID=44249 RepID=A0ABW3D9L8_9BACL|nr:hypothetical protein [Aneurinibacillus sp. XH2]